MTGALLVYLASMSLDGTPSESEAAGDLAGRYEAKLPDGVRCQLDIQASGAFAARCKTGLPVHGRIKRFGNSILLEPISDAWDTADRAYWHDYSTAAGMHLEQTRREHGFYPGIAAPKPDLPAAGIGSIAFHVRWRTHGYLVDFQARSGFCSAVRAGQEPEGGGERSPIFRRQGKPSGTGLDWAAFCASGRRHSAE